MCRHFHFGMLQAAGSETKTTGRDGDYGRFCNFMGVVIKKKGSAVETADR